MNLADTLFNPNGRSSQREYIAGVAILLAANLVSSVIPVLGEIVWIGLIYVGLCVYGRRLHDAGRTAWFHLIPWVLSLLLMATGVMLVGGAMIGALLTQPGETAMAVLFGGGMLALLTFAGLSMVVWIVYTIWVGVLVPEPAANRYGPPPGVPEPVPAPVPPPA
jgi:uncharacterized membrane protein YhaH (DUF805 family)